MTQEEYDGVQYDVYPPDERDEVTDILSLRVMLYGLAHNIIIHREDGLHYAIPSEVEVVE